MRHYIPILMLIICSIDIQTFAKQHRCSVCKTEEQVQLDEKLPDFAQYDYLLKLRKNVEENKPTTQTLSSIQNFVGLASRGLMYAHQSPYADHLLQFALLNLQANAWQTKLLGKLVRENFSYFKKTIKNRKSFFELLDRISKSCNKTRDKLSAATLAGGLDFDALRIIANFSHEEATVFDQVIKVLAQSKKETSKQVRSITQLANSIKTIFNELDSQLNTYIKNTQNKSLQAHSKWANEAKTTYGPSC